MVTIVTPDWESDLIARMDALNPGETLTITGDARNIDPGREFKVGGHVAHSHYFVSYVTERQLPTLGAEERDVDVQILYRFRDDERATAQATMLAWYDALHRSGAFTGASGHGYHDIWAKDLPVFLEPTYYALNVTMLWRTSSP